MRCLAGASECARVIEMCENPIERRLIIEDVPGAVQIIPVRAGCFVPLFLSGVGLAFDTQDAGKREIRVGSLFSLDGFGWAVLFQLDGTEQVIVKSGGVCGVWFSRLQLLEAGQGVRSQTALAGPQSQDAGEGVGIGQIHFRRCRQKLSSFFARFICLALCQQRFAE